MHATNYLEEKMLNLLRGIQMTAPNKVYLALFLSDPTDTGAAGTEIIYAGYARQEIRFTEPAAENGGMSMSNANAIGFETSLVDAGTVTYVAIFDAAIAGHMLCYCPMDSPLHIAADITPVFRVGSISWEWSGNFSADVEAGIMNTFRGINMPGISPYVALCNGDISASGTEFSGNNYARFSVAFSAPVQDQSGAGLISNMDLLLSNYATGTWGNLSHLAIMTAETGGSIFAVIALTSAITVSTGMTVGIEAGKLKLTAA